MKNNDNDKTKETEVKDLGIAQGCELNEEELDQTSGGIPAAKGCYVGLLYCDSLHVSATTLVVKNPK